MGMTRSKIDPSFDELCEQTRIFEEVRVSSNGSAGESGLGSFVDRNGFSMNAILDESTQPSWSGFEGRNNGAASYNMAPNKLTSNFASLPDLAASNEVSCK